MRDTELPFCPKEWCKNVILRSIHKQNWRINHIIITLAHYQARDLALRKKCIANYETFKILFSYVPAQPPRFALFFLCLPGLLLSLFSPCVPPSRGQVRIVFVQMRGGRCVGISVLLNLHIGHPNNHPLTPGDTTCRPVTRSDIDASRPFSVEFPKQFSVILILLFTV